MLSLFYLIMLGFIRQWPVRRVNRQNKGAAWYGTIFKSLIKGLWSGRSSNPGCLARHGYDALTIHKGMILLTKYNMQLDFVLPFCYVFLYLQGF